MVTLALSTFAFVAVFLLTAIALNAPAARQEALRRRIGSYLPEIAERERWTLDILREQRAGLAPTIDRLVERTSFAERLSQELARAELPLRPGEYIAIHIVTAGLLFAAIALISRNALLGVLALPLPYVAITLFVRRRQISRVKSFERQLPEAVDILNTSVRSGFSVLQGLEAVAREMSPPINGEFSQVVQDVSVGMRFDDALARLCDRVPSHDVYLLVTAIMIHRNVGGNLSIVLAGIVQTVRERLRLREEVHAISTTQRVSSYIIAVLPVAVFMLVYLTNYQYVQALWSTAPGQAMSMAAALFLLLGLLISHRMTRVDY